MTRTMTLFETRQSISEQYIPISWIEKLNQKVKIVNQTEEKPGPGADTVSNGLIKAPSRKPSVLLKATNKKSSYLSDYPTTRGRADAPDGSGNYNPDLFSFGIEVRLMKCLTYFLSILTDAMPLVDFATGGAPGIVNTRGDPNYYPKVNTKTNSSLQFKYDQNFWFRIPDYVIALQRYCYAANERMAVNSEVYSKGLVHLCLTNASSETAYQTQLTNCIFPILTKSELDKLSAISIEMSLFVLVMLKGQLNSIDRSIAMSVSEQMTRVQQESHRLMLDHESGMRNQYKPNRGTSSIMNRISNGSIRRDEEDRDTSGFLSVMKNYIAAR